MRKDSPLVLFGAQSGRPTEADVIRTLETAREAGYSDFMVYARSGLELEYMGEEWLMLVGHYLHHAERLGMGIWLYDEFNFPSQTRFQKRANTKWHLASPPPDAVATWRLRPTWPMHSATRPFPLAPVSVDLHESPTGELVARDADAFFLSVPPHGIRSIRLDLPPR